MRWIRPAARLLAIITAALATACGGESNQPPVASPASFVGEEDVVLVGKAVGSDPNSKDVLAFVVSSQPLHGKVQLDRSTGAFTYSPNSNYYGDDSLEFFVDDGKARSNAARITFSLAAVNDPPLLADIPPSSNAPDEYPTRISVDPRDVDGDVHDWSVSIGDDSVAAVNFDFESNAVVLRPRNLGQTTVTITASDGVFSSTKSFDFEVLQHTTRRHIAATDPAAVSLEIENRAEVDVEFRLNVNDRLMPGSIEDAIEMIGRASDLVSGEDLAFKIFRAVAQRSDRGFTLTENVWSHEPLTLLNSIGFGYCDDVASAFGYLASAAGYEVRVWTLGGHVVPEVLVDERWLMLDPDIGVYYVDEQGAILGVEDLAARPDLISSPAARRDEVLKDAAIAYSTELAQIYSSNTDNIVWDYYTSPVEPTQFSITLPPSARILMGGIWAPLPHDFISKQEVPIAANIRIELPAGWIGDLPSALVLVAAEGQGVVSVANQEYPIESLELAALLGEFESARGLVRVIRSDTPVVLTFLVNEIAARLGAENVVEIQSFNSGALSTRLIPLDAANRLLQSP